jgi:hypothetical protein
MNRRDFIKKGFKVFGSLCLLSFLPGKILGKNNNLSVKDDFFVCYGFEAKKNSCNACKKHAEFKRFRTYDFAEKSRTHKYCSCKIVKLKCSKDEYIKWFEKEDIFDFRWKRNFN